MRLIIRDRIPYLATIYYASPAIVLAVLSFILAVRSGVLRCKYRASGLFAVGLILLIWWHQSTHYSNRLESVDSAQTHSVLLWNLRNVKAGWPRLLEELKRRDADVIGLVEVGPGDEEGLHQVREAFPEHDVRFVGMGMLLVRGHWRDVYTGSLNHRGSYAQTEAVFENGDRLDVVLVDILAKPWLPRGDAYEALEELLSTGTRDSRLVFGDFNTPPDSVFARSLRDIGLIEAFETAGHGYHVTWPVGLPVLALDQIWLTSATVRSCTLFDTPYSDHRIVSAAVLLPSERTK